VTAFLATSALVLAVASSARAAVLHVSNTDPTCGGLSPCFTSIQAGTDVAGAGDTVRIQGGTYVEQLTILKKNASAVATETDRIVIEPDPEAAPGAVVLDGARDACRRGHAIAIRRSKFVTLRGLVITGAGGPGIKLAGGSQRNQAIRIEQSRVFGNGAPGCRSGSGIRVGGANADTVIANNLIHGNGADGIAFVLRGGRQVVVGNSVHANGRDGLRVGGGQRVLLVNNAVTRNGAHPRLGANAAGVRALSSRLADPANARLLHNFTTSCAETAGERSRGPCSIRQTPGT
jgi:hypothetical protein